jgi:hypothetical protein
VSRGPSQPDPGKIKFQYEENGKPKYKEIIAQALECDPEAKLTTSTISATFKNKTYPKLPTARALGLGIGGPELGTEFEEAWREAWKNHRAQTHKNGMIAARLAQERAQEGQRRRAEQSGTRMRYPSWWPEHRLLRGQQLQTLVVMLINLLFILWIVFREYSIWGF